MLETPDTTPSAPRLCDFLRARQPQIIEAWLERVRSVSPARDLPAPTLIDHLPMILARIASVLERGGPAGPGLDSLSESHAIDRLGRGFDLHHVVREYAMLRSCVLELWAREWGDFIRLGELRQLDVAFDDSISQSIVEYAGARERLLRAVDRIADAAMGSADVATFLHHLLRVTVETATAVDTGAVLLREGEVLRVRAATGLDLEGDLGLTMKIGEGFAGKIAAEGKPHASTVASTDPLVRSPVIKDRGIKALYGVPLVHDGAVIGVAHMGSTTAREFSDEDKLLFRTMANRATAVIVQAQLVEREREAHRQSDRALALVDSLLAASPVGVAFLDRQLRYLRINEALARHNGVPVEDHIGRFIGEVIPEPARFAEPLLRQVLDSGATLDNLEYAIPGPTPGASARWFLGNLFPVRLPSGEVMGVGAVVLDITDRRHSEEAMREAQRRAEETMALLDTLLARSPAGFAFLDRDLRYLRINPALAEMHGMDVRSHLGRPITEVLPADTVQQVAPRLRRVLSTGEPLVGQLISGKLSLAGGEPRHLLASYYPVPGPDGAALGIGAVTTDITAHKRDEEGQKFLAEASRRLASSLDYQQVLETIASLVGSALGRPCAAYGVSEGKVEQVAIQTSGGSPRVEKPAPWPLASAPELAPLLQLDRPGSHALERANLLPFLDEILGDSGRQALLVAPLRARGELVGILAAADGTEPSDATRPDLLEELARRAATALDNARLYADAQRATALREQVLAVVSHDLKSPIAVIHMTAQLLARTKPEPAVKRYLDAIERSLERMDHLIADLLDMASLQSGNLTVHLADCRVGELMADAAQTHGPLALERGVTLITNGQDSNQVVRADRRRLHQVFANLIGNAIKFSPRDSTITLSAASHEREVIFSVADQGPGIAPDEVARIFDRYWSGRRHGQKSTGLGLFISKGIVEAHGGRIWVVSRPGAGSTFHYSVPLASTT